MTGSDCIIVGAGLIGMLSARELALNGMRVTLLEERTAGKQCSWAGGGILSALYPWEADEPLQALCNWSQDLYPPLVDELLRTTHIDPEFWRCGMLINVKSDHADASRWVVQHNATHQFLDATQTRTLAPALNPQNGKWLWLPELAQIRNPRLLSAVKAHLQHLGVTLCEQTEVNRILIEDGKALGAETKRGTFHADVTVIASGAWTSRLWPGVSIKPIKGEMLCFEAHVDTLGIMVLKNYKYAVPRRDGKILIGSTLEDAGFSEEPGAEARRILWESAEELLPGITSYPLAAHWSGLRPASADGLPCIGPWPEIEGLYLSTGHYRNGVLLAPASAKLLAHLILRQTPPIPYDPFLPRITAPG